MSEAAEPSILLRRDGAAGRLIMNRPRAMNSLTQDMIDGFAKAIAEWKDDPSVKLVILEGAGGRAFCAGGDVRAVRAAAIAGDTATVERFFSTEYAVNLGIATFGKPWISLVDGVCMGGGMGVSIHGTHVVATTHAVFAMPETIIALFPDVGGSYAMPRLPGAIGMWLALTGARLNGPDAVHAGVATHYVPRGDLPALEAELLKGDAGAIARFAHPAPEAAFAPHRATIDRCFGAGSVPAIVAALEEDGGAWAQEQLKTLRQVSPSSLYWTHELLKRGATMSLADCLQMELRLTRKVVNQHPDFREGVRALLVDKDNKPQWTPAAIEGVNQAEILAMFD